MKSFPWRAGMRALDKDGHAWRLVAGHNGALCAYGEPTGYCAFWDTFAPLLEAKPDPNDAGTRSALLEVVREVRQEPLGFVLPPGALATGWVYVPNANTSPLWVEGDGHPTEFDALLVAGGIALCPPPPAAGGTPKPFPWRAGMRGTAAGFDNHGAPITIAPVVVERKGGLFWFWPDLDCFGAQVEQAQDEHPAYAINREDPATLGALLGAVEEGWRPVGVITVIAPVAASLGEPWRVRVTDHLGEYLKLFEAPTRFEALMQAHEAAP
jgi:hypothetical protein